MDLPFAALPESGSIADPMEPSPDEASILDRLRHSWPELTPTSGSAFRAVLDSLRSESWDADPWLIAGYGASYRSIGSASRSAAVPYFQAAEAAVDDKTPVESVIGIRLHFASCLRSLGRFADADAKARLALAALEDAELSLAARVQLQARVSVQLGLGQLQLGHSDEALTNLRLAIGLASRLSQSERVECLAGLSLLEFLVGDPEEACDLAARAEAEARDSGLLASAFGAPALIVRLLCAIEQDRTQVAFTLGPLALRASTRSDWEPFARYALATRSALDGNHADGLEQLRLAAQLIRSWQSPGMVRPLLENLKCTLQLMLGDASSAWDSAMAMGQASTHRQCSGSLLGRLRLAAGDPGGALKAIAVCESAIDEHPARSLTDLLLVRAAAKLQLGDLPASDAAFDRALLICARHDAVLPFRALAHETLGKLVERARDRPEARPFAAFLDGVRGSATNGIEPPVEQLSARERAIVHLLHKGLSTAQLAEALFISVNTVKTHLRSIYRKLAVSSRDQAVARVRELGLHVKITND